MRLAPADLRQRTNLDRGLADRDLAAEQGGICQRARGDDAQPSLAHVVNVTGNHLSFGFPCAQPGQFRHRHPKVLGEARLVTPIDFAFRFHAEPSLRAGRGKYIAQMA